jgi:POT family proton-dependent oligopeptide transporter
MVSKLAPIRLSSLLMGTWFLANAAANKFAGTLSALIPPSQEAGSTEPIVYPSVLGVQITNLYEFFMLFIIMTAAAAAILFILSSWLEKMIKEKHDETH